jgi:hypothetical protein
MIWATVNNRFAARIPYQLIVLAARKATAELNGRPVMPTGCPFFFAKFPVRPDG